MSIIDTITFTYGKGDYLHSDNLLCDCAIIALWLIEKKYKKTTCKMMLQPTSGRQGFDYVKDQNDRKRKWE